MDEREGGFKELRKLPSAGDGTSLATTCSFANELVGAFVDARDASEVTRDGGKSWTENPMPDIVERIEFCGADQVAISAGKNATGILYRPV